MGGAGSSPSTATSVDSVVAGSAVETAAFLGRGATISSAAGRFPDGAVEAAPEVTFGLKKAANEDWELIGGRKYPAIFVRPAFHTSAFAGPGGSPRLSRRAPRTPPMILHPTECARS